MAKRTLLSSILQNLESVLKDIVAVSHHRYVSIKEGIQNYRIVIGYKYAPNLSALKKC